MTGIDRDALAALISKSGHPRLKDYERADAVIAHLAATGPRDAGLRERIEALCDEHPIKVATRHLRATLAAPDPGPDQGEGHQHGAACIYSTSHGWTCPAPARDAEVHRDR